MVPESCGMIQESVARENGDPPRVKHRDLLRT